MGNKIQVIVMHSSKNMWLIPAFLKLWERYVDSYGFRLVFCGFQPVDCKGTSVFANNYIIGNQEDYPADRWTDAFLNVLNNVAERTFIFMLEDYLLVRDADVHGIRHLYDYAKDRDYVLKIDLTNDRMWAGGGTRYLWGYNTYGHCGHLDLIRSNLGSEYQMSLWGGVFNRDTLKPFVIPGESAQQLELSGTNRVNLVGDSVLVLGTRQSPIKHTNIIQGGTLNMHELVGLPALEQQDRIMVEGLRGYIR